MSNPQKTLKIISIAYVVFAVLYIIVGAIATYVGGVFAVGGVEIMNQLGESEEATMMAGGGMIALLLGIASLVAGIINIIVGILGLGVAKDGRRVKLFSGMCIFALVMVAISAIATFAEGSFPLIGVIEIAVIALALRCANEIKNSLN